MRVAAVERHLAAPCRYCAGRLWRSWAGFHCCDGCTRSVACTLASGRCTVCESSLPSGMPGMRCGARHEPGGCQSEDTWRMGCGAYRCRDHAAHHWYACPEARGAA